MIKDKQYKNITEVSNLLKINKHVIRYWDSKFDGISVRLSDNKRRLFNQENINKIKKLQEVLYQNGKQNYSLELANKIINRKKPESVNTENDTLDGNYNIKFLQEISHNLKKLLK